MPSSTPSAPATFRTPLARLEQHRELFRRGYAHFTEASRAGASLWLPAEWFLDNYYLIAQTIAQIPRDLNRGFFRRLPCPPRDSGEPGVPRVVTLARALIASSCCRLDMEWLAERVLAHQETEPLTTAELWALPIMLRLAAVDALADAVRRLITPATAPAGESPEAEPAAPDAAEAPGAFERCDEPAPCPGDERHVDDQIVEACIASLHALSEHDWKSFVERVSLVDRALRRDPVAVYPAMDFATRDGYRKIVECVARDAEIQEQRVALAAVRLAERGRDDARRYRHVGYYLLGPGRRALEAEIGYTPPPARRLGRWLAGHPTAVYLGGVGALTAVQAAAIAAWVSVAGGSSAAIALAVAAALIPAVAVAVAVVNLIVAWLIPPRLLPRLDFESGIPRPYQTLVVVPCLLSGADEVSALVDRLERHYLSNPDPRLSFALLSDFTDAEAQHMPGDDALVTRAIRAIEALNARHGGDRMPFYLLHRRREWNPREGVWMGWERKRGKLAELNRLLRGSTSTSYEVQVGDLDALPATRYVLTLDADTQLPRDSPRRLVAILAHPLNEAEFCPRTERLIAGYSLLQPRVEIVPESAHQSLYTRLFAGETGLDLYTMAVSDVYQDLFGEGIFVGKGLYDIDAFERSVAGRVPENAILSHDLFEGIHGRAGLVTDVLLFEEFPPNYVAHVLRLQRWIRGDWQLVPWLRSRVADALGRRRRNRLSLISRWKIFDNLRRSLVAPAQLALLVLGWVWLPGEPLVWTALAVGALAVPLVAGAITGWVREVGDDHVVGAFGPLRDALLRWALTVAFIPFETVVITRSVAITLLRVAVTRRRLLQWTTAASVARRTRDKRSLRWTFRLMLPGLVVTAAALALVVVLRPTALWASAPILALWFGSPWLAYRISRPRRRATALLTRAHERKLGALARSTWLYFEQFAGPEDHWLPPDNVQETPERRVAHRTSPTNVGLFLLSALAAHDRGYLGQGDLALRLRQSFASLLSLERYRGHFLNWYDTANKAPLWPRYVSAVDSGNLAGSLLALRRGCREVTAVEVIGPRRWRGLLDTVALLDEGLHGLAAPGASEARAALSRLYARIEAAHRDPAGYPRLVAEVERELWPAAERHLLALARSEGLDDADRIGKLSAWSERLRHDLEALRRDIDRYVPWLTALSAAPATVGAVAGGARLGALREALPPAPPLAEIPAVCEAAAGIVAALRDDLGDDSGDDAGAGARWCDELTAALSAAGAAARSLLVELDVLALQAGSLADEMDFGFLFDRQRMLFHIGYNVESERLDTGHYDLLASEARLTSLIAIARNQVPQRHWLALGRRMTASDGQRALVSWSGTLFEYLMPDLLTKRFESSLLDESCRVAIECQIAYGRRRGVPWGVSESGFAQVDAAGNYQYRAFGVPRLGLKRGLADDLVVAPYASILALSERPHAVMENLDALARDGARGIFGMYEAVDYTPSRLPIGAQRVVVRSHMAHHQGMILVALCNALNGSAMIRRFHADTWIRSVELLLQEKLPRRIVVDHRPDWQELPPAPRTAPATTRAWPAEVAGPRPVCHCLSNGRYRVVISAAGAGYSAYDGVALTRWRADTTLEEHGSWLYVRDCDDGAVWSAARQPVGRPDATDEAQFYGHKVELRRLVHDILVTTEITVAAHSDVELRRVAVTNRSDHARRLQLFSYAEVVLSPLDADRRHPGFNKLFIEGDYVAGDHALVFRRRPRERNEKRLYLAHAAWRLEGAHPAGETGSRASGHSLGYETDRGKFLGRGRTVRAPVAVERGRLSNTVGATLDPVMVMAEEIELAPHSSAELVFATAAAATRGAALTAIRAHRDAASVERAFKEAAAAVELDLHRRDLEPAAMEGLCVLLSALVYPHAALRADPAVIAANTTGAPALWGYGVSGDHPILLLQLEAVDPIAQIAQIAVFAELVEAHSFWRQRGVAFDLVVLDHSAGYTQDLEDKMHHVLRRRGSDTLLFSHGGIFILRADQLAPASRAMLETAARVSLHGGDSLARQLASARAPSAPLPSFEPVGASGQGNDEERPLPRPEGLRFDNGVGGFDESGREYIIYVRSATDPDAATPAPWCNVLANATFGCLVSESSLGVTWAENSGEMRLTPWRSDPVSDPGSEAIYLRDEETGEVWTPTPRPAGTDAPYVVHHGAGYTVYRHACRGIEQTLTVVVAPDAPVVLLALQLANTTGRARRVTATYFAPWVLGHHRDATQQYVIPEYSAGQSALLARNPANVEHGDRVAFVCASRPPRGLTTDRAEFLGRLGDPARPAALDRIGLSGTVRAGDDPCAALQLDVDLAPAGSEQVVFAIGQGASRAEALQLAESFGDPDAAARARRDVDALWDSLLGAVQVETPEPAMDIMLNRWLLYQTVACRLWARTAFYQSSGAYGFRDQLQDVMASLHTAPALCREQLLRAARHQFTEGDVLHWWHPPLGRGVRTRISDDLLWLPYVAAEYVEATGDAEVLDERVRFLSGAPLAADEHERYAHFAPADCPDAAASLFEHCRRALDRGDTRGRHGLPRIGGGDWNDGMNRVGVRGEGESVWLGWFLHATLTRFARLCERRGDAAAAAGYRQRARELAQAADAAWDGEWYLRAFYDDGTPLGSRRDRECRIDAIAQSWAVLSGAAPPDRARQAMQSAADQLIRDRLVLLFTPPFDRSPRDPGYIKGYPPGIRENGGQYTHAAVWTAWAFAALGDGDQAEALFRLLDPIHHADTPERRDRYRVEPYVIAADVYGAPPHTGRGGWTWYTGAAGWLYRLGVEAILGVRRRGDSRGDHLHVDPCIPRGWPGFRVRYRTDGGLLDIRVDNAAGVGRGVAEVWIDGVRIAGERGDGERIAGERIAGRDIPLPRDGRRREVRVVLGPSRDADSPDHARDGAGDDEEEPTDASLSL